MNARIMKKCTIREKGKLDKTGSDGLDSVSFSCENLNTGYTMFLPVKIESKEYKFVIDQACQISGFRAGITGFFHCIAGSPALMSILPAKLKICWHIFFRYSIL